MRKIAKKGQEEMVGFGIIIVIVIIIGLVFLWLYLAIKPNETNMQDYEVQSFLRSVTQYTTRCIDREYIEINDLTYLCFHDQRDCENGDSCQILEDTLDSILDSAWDVGEGKRVRGYEINITVLELDQAFIKTIYSRNKGILNGSSRGFSEKYMKDSKWYDITFIGYYD